MLCANTIWKTITIIAPRNAEEKSGKAMEKLRKAGEKRDF